MGAVCDCAAGLELPLLALLEVADAQLAELTD